MGMVSTVVWSVLAVHKVIDVPLLVKCNSFFSKSMMHLCISKKSSPRIASTASPSTTITFVANVSSAIKSCTVATPCTCSVVPSTPTSLCPVQGSGFVPSGFTWSHKFFCNKVTAAPVPRTNIALLLLTCPVILYTGTGSTDTIYMSEASFGIPSYARLLASRVVIFPA